MTSGGLLEFHSKEANIGDVNPGEHKTVIMRVKNAGLKDLVITGIAADCMCTIIKIDTHIIHPGKVAILHVTYQSNMKQKENEEIMVPVVVRSNSINKLDEFYLKGVIKARK